MSTNSAIEWTTHTFNPWWGCTKVHDGCKHCYAETLDHRWGGDHWGPRASRRMIVGEWSKPAQWNREAQAKGERARVFCASMCDLFEAFTGHVVDQQDRRVPMPAPMLAKYGHLADGGSGRSDRREPAGGDSLRTLRLPQLPAMRCDRGCGDCCGPVACPREEYARVVAVIKAQKIQPLRQGITCPLYIDGACSVYDARPTVCRIFGHSPLMKCSRGYDVHATAGVVREYEKVMVRGGKNNAVLLHGLVYSESEFQEIWDEYLASENDQPTEPTAGAPALGAELGDAT